MKCLITFLLFLGPFVGQCQWLATIRDDDGYTNVREAPSTKSKILGKIYDDQIFHIWDLDYDTIPKWRKISKWYPEKQKSLVGWMHVSRVRELDFLREPVSAKISENGRLLTFQNDTILFQIEFEEFDSSKHEIVRHERGHIRTVNGKYARGTDGSMPSEGIRSIRFFLNGQKISIPKEAYSDLYEFRKSTFEFLVNTTGTIMVKSFNSDGAGFYMLVWKFKDYQYFERFIGTM